MTPQSPLEGSRRSQRLSCRSTQMRSLNRSDPGSRRLNSRSATLKQMHSSGGGDGRLRPSMTVLQTEHCKRVRNAKASNFTQVNRPTRPLQDISVNCLVKKQQGRKHSSNSPTSFSEPLPTDPASTAILWQQVRAWSLASMIPRLPSNSRRQVPPPSTGRSTRSQSDNLASPSSTRTATRSQGDKSGSFRGGKSGSARSGKSASSNTNTSTQGVTIKDPNFREKILTPRGIVITDQGGLQGQMLVLDTPYSYFQTRVPPPGTCSANHYNGAHGSPSAPIESKVWLDISESRVDSIAEEYQVMNKRHLNEDEFASYAKEQLLKQDRRVLDPNTRFWTVDRMAKPTLKPEKLLEVPPIVEEGEDSAATFRFHLFPDCMYWISLHGFNPDYRSSIKGQIHVIKDSRVTCPYLTVEFKREGMSPDQAENQAAAASALMLYNRYRLRLKRLKAEKAPINRSSFKDVMHYGLVFCGADWDFYICQPTLTDNGEWNGCTMSLVASYDCTLSRDVKFVLEWLNEIHFWGMHVHGKGCENDLKGYLLATLPHASRVSEVLLL